MLGFGAFSVPQRRDAPTAAAPVSTPFTDWGGSASAWEEDWQRRYNEEAAKYRPATGSIAQLIPGSPDYNADAAAPWHQQQRQTLGNVFDTQFGYGKSALGAQYDDLRNSWVDYSMRTYTQPSNDGATHYVRTPDYDPGYMPDFSALNAERERLLPFAEPQMRQQQAYDWMEGAHQQNAIMSPEYANAGFNTITGTSNPYAGPDAASLTGIDTDWLQGVYDPSTQRATGTYNPTNYSKNTGW